MIRRPPSSTLLPHTTPFRSLISPYAFDFQLSTISAETPAPPAPALPQLPNPPASPDHPTSPAKSAGSRAVSARSEEHTSELQSPDHLLCRLLLEKKKQLHNT